MLSPIATSGFVSQQQVDGERRRLGAALDVAGERDGGAELAERARPRERGAGDEAGQHERQRHPAGDGRRPGPERRGGVLVAPVHRPQRGLDGDHEERHRDERLGHDDAPAVENVSCTPNQS